MSQPDHSAIVMKIFFFDQFFQLFGKRTYLIENIMINQHCNGGLFIDIASSVRHYIFMLYIGNQTIKP